MGSKQRRQERRRRREEKRKNTKPKSAQPPSSPSLPEDLVVDIISRLPLHSLYRFAGVSKQWRSLTSAAIASKTGRKMVVVLSKSKSKKATYSLRSIEQEVGGGTHVIKTVRKPWNTNKVNRCGHRIRIFGSCKGLLLVGVGDDLFLWNPLTRYFEKVLSFERLRDPDSRTVSGLCYDSATNEYKVVMVLGYYLVVVGSFRSKSWTEIPFPYDTSTVNSGPVVNEHLYWFVKKNYLYGSPSQIVRFNPHMGAFEEVPMPQPKHDVRDILLGLGALDGCLHMSRLENPHISDGDVEVLAMKEYGAEKSWTIMFVISNLTSHPYRKLVPLCCSKNGEVIMGIRKEIEPWRTKESCHIEAYNPNDNSHGEIPITIPTRSCYVDVVVYEESPVRPIGYDWEEEDGEGKQHMWNISSTNLRGNSNAEGMVTGTRRESELALGLWLMA